MKLTQKLSTLAVGIMVMLFGAIQAQAANVIIENNNVIRIENLELNFDQDSLDGFYNVDFVNDIGSDLFPSGFDFDNPEDAGTTIIQINNALNLNNPVPTGASSAGTSQFFIPGIEVFGVWGAFGSEFFSPGGVPGWDACEIDCLSGIGILRPSDTNTFARVSAVPVPAAVWLFGSGLLGLVGIARRKKAA